MSEQGRGLRGRGPRIAAEAAGAPGAARHPRGFKALLFGAILALAACSLVFTQPVVRISAVRVASLGITGGTAEVVVEVDNPNGYDLEVRGLEYRLQVVDEGAPGGWRELSTGEWPDTVKLPSKDTARVVVRLPFDYTALGSAVNAILSTGGVEYQVEGETRVGGPTGEYQVPFRQRGTLRP